MKKYLAILLVLLWVSPAMGLPLDPYYEDDPLQDPLYLLEPHWHELGDLFPPNELIVSSWEVTQETACFDGGDDPGILNILVTMTNLSPNSWYSVHYIADPQTLISNFDGYIGNAGLFDAEEAFKIDNIGINRPLQSESLNANLIFEPDETWVFIIQDFTNDLGGTPTPFDSEGIAGLSTGFPLSTGSIIATTPEPATMLLLSAGLIGCAGLSRKKFFKKG